MSSTEPLPERGSTWFRGFRLTLRDVRHGLGDLSRRLRGPSAERQVRQRPMTYEPRPNEYLDLESRGINADISAPPDVGTPSRADDSRAGAENDRIEDDKSPDRKPVHKVRGKPVPTIQNPLETAQKEAGPASLEKPAENRQRGENDGFYPDALDDEAYADALRSRELEKLLEAGELPGDRAEADNSPNRDSLNSTRAIRINSPDRNSFGSNSFGSDSLDSADDNRESLTPIEFSLSDSDSSDDNREPPTPIDSHYLGRYYNRNRDNRALLERIEEI
jgi:hypothetical protein